VLLKEEKRLKNGFKNTYYKVLKFKCDHCGNQFEYVKSKLGQRVKNKKLPKFCSRVCVDKFSIKPCSVTDCNLRSFGFGYCRKHYVSYKRYGRALILPKYNCKICNIEFTARPNYRNARIKEIKNLYCNKCHIIGYRNFIINKLGGKCECCKEKEIIFLEIDHIKGGGGKHRKKYSGSGKAGRYAYLDDILKKNKSYRVLCRNCNWGVFKGKNGICPHKQLKK